MHWHISFEIGAAKNPETTTKTEMDLSLERDSSALGSLFQQIINDMKVSDWKFIEFFDYFTEVKNY